MTDKIDWSIHKNPILLNGTTVIVVTVCKTESNLEDFWVNDYIDFLKEDKNGARDLIKQISGECSINMLWSLREAIEEQINEQNAEFGTSHPIDRPKE